MDTLCRGRLNRLAAGRSRVHHNGLTIRCCSPLFDVAHGDSSDQQATLVCITTCERTVFSGRNSDESRKSLPGSTLIEGTVPGRWPPTRNGRESSAPRFSYVLCSIPFVLHVSLSSTPSIQGHAHGASPIQVSGRPGRGASLQ